MTKSMTGKVAIVTGGAQGIGKGIVKRLLQEGMSALIADMDGEAAEEAAAEYVRLGEVAGAQADVGNEADVERMVREAVSRFGRLDLLVNNAGIASHDWGPVERLDLVTWNRVITVNLTGVFLCSKYSIPHLRKTKGSIVNIASTRALQSEPDTEPYSASKGGVVALTHALAMSLGPEIRVNCISPGWIDVGDWKKGGRRDTAMLRPEDHAQHPAGRAGSPEDVAEMVLYLASPGAAFVTGQNLIIDGGMTRRMIYIE
ncbi:glucose 1-dehydrogenase [Geobacter sp. DSM 9736]|uniref:glucose 1-dehydrogenase n=1 Tax=Geobacter sp. DSM 9736 TaxID=1277350 RepID=UPI000B50D454|nr:glucose 1-dehydrogenase [Geobacter sp. DSM 9736]SNB47176.1 hypothetical protein SAMN06269301_2654 [Geobacter sp. DSM 9736]